MENVNVRDNRIIFDWLAFTIHNLDVNEVILMLGLNDCLGNFQEMKGHDGYKDRLFFNGISIYFNGHENQGIHICFSGQGCRAFESYSEYADFNMLLSAVLFLVCRTLPSAGCAVVPKDLADADGRREDRESPSDG